MRGTNAGASNSNQTIASWIGGTPTGWVGPASMTYAGNGRLRLIGGYYANPNGSTSVDYMSLYIQGGNAFAYNLLVDVSATASQINAGYNGVGGALYLNNLSNGPVIIGSNLGIGKAPAYSLDVAGDINYGGVLRKSGVAVNLTGANIWTANGATAYIMGSNIGIGTASPAVALDVAGQERVINAAANVSNLTVASWTTGTPTGWVGPGSMIYRGDGKLLIHNNYYSSTGIRTLLDGQGVDILGGNSSLYNLVASVAATSTALNAYYNGAGGVLGLNTTSNGPVRIGSNLGIGKNPSYPLDVLGDVNITGSYYINGTALSTQQPLWQPAAGGNCYFNGSAGLWTSSPQYVFDCAYTGRFNGLNNTSNKLLTLWDGGTAENTMTSTNFGGFGWNTNALGTKHQRGPVTASTRAQPCSSMPQAPARPSITHQLQRAMTRSRCFRQAHHQRGWDLARSLFVGTGQQRGQVGTTLTQVFER